MSKSATDYIQNIWSKVFYIDYISLHLLKFIYFKSSLKKLSISTADSLEKRK